MADIINPAVIKLTQDTLGNYVKKPSLSEKLLKKPPFRFLHDVFSVVIRDTGCFAGLYTAEELKSENIKDRDDKMKFLQKMIDVVRICTNVPLTVKTSKIVAGHEAEKTNELLQLIGKIIEGNLNWQPAVEQVLRGKDSKMADKPTDKSKEVDMKGSKDPKTKKGSNKSKPPSVSSKEHNTKMSREKEKLSVTKKDPSKGAKSSDKTRRKSKDAIVKPMLTKTDSETSRKSPSPKKQETASTTKSSTNVKECDHEEITVNAENKAEILNSLSTSQVETNNRESVEKEDAPSKQPAQPEKSQHKLSAKSRTLESEESINLPSGKEKYNSRNSSPKNSSKTSTKVDEGEDVKILSDNGTLNSISFLNNFQNPVDKSENIELIDKPVTSEVQPATGFNEVRRESTFTRENSKEIPNQASKPSRPKTSLRPPSARPPSARPGAPRRRDRNVEIILQPNEQMKMSGIQVKLETFGDLEDDGENLVIIENANTIGLSDDPDLDQANSQSALDGETAEQGHLVHQILETQKELTQQNDLNQQIKNEKDSVNGSLVMKQTSTHNMNNLRDVIQNLTKSVNPLGKLMDFIPEDIDAMQLEFTMWRDAYTQAANQLKREKSLTESATEPMKNQLVQIEANITEYMEMIDASRVKILQSNEKILKMLTMP